MVDRTNCCPICRNITWVILTLEELEKFICVLFTASVNSKSDMPKNWFSQKHFYK